MKRTGQVTGWRKRGGEAGGGRRERKDILWSSNGPADDDVFTNRRHINRLGRESDKEHVKTVSSTREAPLGDSFVISLAAFVLRRIPRKGGRRVEGGTDERPPCKIHRGNGAERRVGFRRCEIYVLYANRVILRVISVNREIEKISRRLERTSQTGASSLPVTGIKLFEAGCEL